MDNPDGPGVVLQEAADSLQDYMADKARLELHLAVEGIDCPGDGSSCLEGTEQVALGKVDKETGRGRRTSHRVYLRPVLSTDKLGRSHEF